jgi:MFS family permease
MAITTSQQRTSLALTAILHGINHATYSMLPPLEPSLTRFFGFSDKSPVSLGFTLYLACYGFSQIVMGILSDRFSRKALLTAGALLNGAAVAAVAAFPSYHMYIAGLALAGLGGSAYHPVGVTYLSDLYPNARGSALGISGIGATLGLFVGPVLGGLLVDASNWRTTFLVFACANILLGLLFAAWAVEPETDLTDGAGPSQVNAGACANQSRNGAWPAGLALFLFIGAMIFLFREFAGWGGYFLIPVFSATYFQFSASAAGMLSGLQSAGGFVSQPLGGWLSDRLGRRRMLTVLFSFVALFLFLMPHVGPNLLAPVVILYGLAYSATVPILDALIADRTPARIRGLVFGIFMSVGIGFSSFSNIVLAHILDTAGAGFKGFATCFTLLAVSASIALALVFVSLRTQSPKSIQTTRAKHDM